MINNKKRYAVLVSNYPTDEKPNTFGFVHSRVRAYKRLGIYVDVYRISIDVKKYEFEEVSVYCGDKEYIKKQLQKINYDTVLIHFLDQDKIDIVEDRRCVIWVHGFEALSWKRRLYNINPRLPLYMIENTKQLKAFKKYAISHPQSKFIFVSNWMHDITCADIKFNIKNYAIIHNYIDSTIFTYNEKKVDMRKKFLLVRSFENKKYANDISVSLIEALSKKPYFGELEFTIYGDGKFFNRLTNRLKKFNNVKIEHKFITQKEISDLQKEHGIFLCPTRQDAQGVSMCEAMSSGLVPLTSDNTAIPEFVEDKKEGFLCNNKKIETFVRAYGDIYDNKDLFRAMSYAASARVQKQCSFENTIMKEIEIIDAFE